MDNVADRAGCNAGITARKVELIMAEQWHYARDGKQFGPVSTLDLKNLASKGQLLRTDLVWKPGMPDWIPSGKIKGLFAPSPRSWLIGGIITVGVLPLLIVAIVVWAIFLKKPPGSEYFVIKEKEVFDVKKVAPFTGEVKGVAIVSNREKVTIGGKEYYKTVTTFQDIPGFQTHVSYTRLGDDGVYSRESTDANAPETLVFPLPPTVGRTWSFVQPNGKIEKRIASIEDYDTAKNTYRQCLKLISNGSVGNRSFSTTTYYAPSIGLVLMSTEWPDYMLEVKRRE